jgi:hypothetical protein
MKGSPVGILDSGPEEPKSKLRRWVISAVALVFLLGGFLWYHFRFYPEKKAAAEFFNALTSGDSARAYQLWKPNPNYTMKDFLDDWGPNGYWGPVKSYRIESTAEPKHGGSGVIVIAEISQFSPFPEDDDAKNRRTKEVRIWVQIADKSLSFPP